MLLNGGCDERPVPPAQPAIVAIADITSAYIKHAKARFERLPDLTTNSPVNPNPGNCSHSARIGRSSEGEAGIAFAEEAVVLITS